MNKKYARYGWIDIGYRKVPRLTPIITLIDRKRGKQLGEAIKRRITNEI